MIELSDTSISFNVGVKADEVIFAIENSIDADDIPHFIASLELAYANWQVTEKLINHFLAVLESDEAKELIKDGELVIKPEKLI